VHKDMILKQWFEQRATLRAEKEEG
jgi:hypothetical protein